jgi:hypothetical protein
MSEDREIRRRPEAQIECPKCGKPVTLVAETHEWAQRGGRWRHTEYGPATGECCGLAFLDAMGEILSFVIEQDPKQTEGAV